MNKTIIAAVIALLSFSTSGYAEPTEKEIHGAAIEFIRGIGAIKEGSYEFPIRIIPSILPSRVKESVEIKNTNLQKASAYLATVNATLRVSKDKVKNANLLLILIETPQGWVLAGGKDLGAQAATQKPQD